MPGVPWIKLWTCIFDDEKIKIIRSLPEGDTIVLCWLKLLCMAGKCGMGGIVAVNEAIPYTDDMLSTVWDVPVSTVHLALTTLKKLQMIKVEQDGMMLIQNWSRYQSIKSYEDVQEQWRIRQQRHREKQIEDMSRDISRDVTPQEVEVEVEVEVDKSILSGKAPDRIPFDEIIAFLNEKTASSYKPSTKATRGFIKARWNEGFRLEHFKKAILWASFKWSGDPKFVDYLRPQTLFSGKMESYVQNYERQVNGK